MPESQSTAHSDKSSATSKEGKPGGSPPAEQTSPSGSASSAAPAASSERSSEGNGGRTWVFYTVLALGGLTAIFVLVLIIALIIGIVSGKSENAAIFVAIIRDLFIILLAMEGMLIGIALIVMILQLASLINILENEIQPIVDSAQEAVSAMRGTAEFMSKNVTQPVIKTSATLAATKTFMREVLGIRKAMRGTGKTGQPDSPPEASPPVETAADGTAVKQVEQEQSKGE